MYVCKDLLRNMKMYSSDMVMTMCVCASARLDKWAFVYELNETLKRSLNAIELKLPAIVAAYAVARSTLREKCSLAIIDTDID